MNPEKRRWLTGLGLALLFMFILTLSPFAFSKRWLDTLLALSNTALMGSLFYLSVRDLMLNILFFVPFGAILRGYDRVSGRLAGGILRPLFLALIVSGLIEGLQLFLQRSSTFADLAANTAGCIVGYMGFEFFRQSRVFALIRCRRMTCRKPSIVLFVYSALLLILALLPLRVNRLEGWSAAFPMCIGNEKTGDRQWKGDVGFVTVFGRALKYEEVARLRETLPPLNHSEIGSRSRLTEDVPDERMQMVRRYLDGLCLYHVASGRDTVPDLFGFEPALARVSDPPGVENKGRPDSELQYGEDGLFFRTDLPLRRMVRSIQAVSEFSVEALIRTEQLDQDGPARIVTVSDNPDERNFTLGQSGSRLVFRVRSPLAGLNGSRIRLISDPVLQPGAWQHIVAVYNRGMERFFVDGKPGNRLIRADIHYLPALVTLGRNGPARIAFGLVTLLPLSILIFSFFRPAIPWLMPLLVAGCVLLIQLSYLVLIGQPIDMSFVAGAFLIGLGGYWIARQLLN